MIVSTCPSVSPHLYVSLLKPIMPIDMALPLYLSKEEFVFRATPKTCKPTLNSCLRFHQSNRVGQTEPQDGRSSRKTTKAKKQVTFADHKGLSLTNVKIFSQFSDPIEIPLNIQENLSSTLSLTAEKDQLVLDFTQPSSDYLHFRQSLESNYVCLEHCMLKEKALAGTIKVKNVSFEKSVKLRVTFDTWKSHTDVDCKYMKDTYPSSYSDTFSFQVSLPEELQPHECIEFAVCYEVGGCEYWDSNRGSNYRIVWSSMKSSRQDACSHRTDSFDFMIHFDRYGSPTCSHGLFPDWPSYAGYENIGPYY
ncbi:protein phosphatase 1 regulatory subunit 3B isoform X1 [Anabas testudineus]|uniref:Protein phosphatase 1 regulatory subunit n=2 Tax=Anabas testudineus TaxID=64144 RepID=A0A3Q1JLL2_ANATE|nr:protein phosphatase 1 regulatory subunit 3B isoform X1 [Anabas testudineus]